MKPGELRRRARDEDWVALRQEAKCGAAEKNNEDEGKSAADAGNGDTGAGNGEADAGKSAADAGKSAANAGNGEADAGKSAADAGNVEANAGNIEADGDARIAERVRKMLLLKLEQAADSFPCDATELKTQEDSTVKLLKLRDLTAAYKELVGDLPREGEGEEHRVVVDV